MREIMIHIKAMHNVSKYFMVSKSNNYVYVSNPYMVVRFNRDFFTAEEENYLSTLVNCPALVCDIKNYTTYAYNCFDENIIKDFQFSKILSKEDLISAYEKYINNYPKFLKITKKYAWIKIDKTAFNINLLKKCIQLVGKNSELHIGETPTSVAKLIGDNGIAIIEPYLTYKYKETEI